jgi:hypothetical protein
MATLAVFATWVLLSVATLGDLSQNTVGLPGRATPWALLLTAAIWCGLVASAAHPQLAGSRQLPRSAVA